MEPIKREETPTQQFCRLVRSYAAHDTSYRLPRCSPFAGLICSQGLSSENRLSTPITSVLRNLPDADNPSAMYRLRGILPVHQHELLHKKLFGLIRYLQSRQNVVIHSGYLLNDLLRWNDPSHPVQREWLHRIMGPIGYKHLSAKKKEQGSDVSPDDAVDTPHA